MGGLISPKNDTEITHTGRRNGTGMNYDQVLKQSGVKFNPCWILLYSKSIFNIFCNRFLITNIRQSTTCKYTWFNIVITTTWMIWNLPSFGTVWYHEYIISNILSLARVKKYWVKHDRKMGTSYRWKTQWNCVTIQRVQKITILNWNIWEIRWRNCYDKYCSL